MKSFSLSPSIEPRELPVKIIVATFAVGFGFFLISHAKIGIPHKAVILNSGAAEEPAYVQSFPQIGPPLSKSKPKATGPTTFSKNIALLEKPRSEQVASSTTPVVVVPALPPERTIDPETIVGLICYFKRTGTDLDTGEPVALDDIMVRASGVIVSANGYVLTSRHVIDQKDEIGTFEGTSSSFTIHNTLQYCNIGQVDANSHLPTPAEIRSINPNIVIPQLKYRAILISTPPQFDSDETYFADFAFLKIVGINSEVSADTVLPSRFPYAELISVANVQEGSDVVTYGFPSDVSEGKQMGFSTLFMTGSVGKVTEIRDGTDYYMNTPLEVLTDMEIFRGRSGSPLFWRGYVIGLVRAYDVDNRTKSHSVASDAILKDFPS